MFTYKFVQGLTFKAMELMFASWVPLWVELVASTLAACMTIGRFDVFANFLFLMSGLSGL